MVSGRRWLSDGCSDEVDEERKLTSELGEKEVLKGVEH